jgi:hypothetical protein
VLYGGMVSHMKRLAGVALIAVGVMAIGALLAAGFLLPWVLAVALMAVLAGAALVITGRGESPKTRATGHP